MDKDSQESISLQIGVLMQTLAVVIRHMDIMNPAFQQDLRSTLQKFADLQQSRPFSDDNVDLINEMVQTLLGVLPRK